MAQHGIGDKDLEEVFIHSSGPGGQNVNKVASCVFLLHRPTGIQVKCQSERSQALNRFRARCLLVAKIEQEKRQRQLQETQRREKERRKNRKKPAALKEVILKQKKYVSQKKLERQKIDFRKLDQY